MATRKKKKKQNSISTEEAFQKKSEVEGKCFPCHQILSFEIFSYPKLGRQYKNNSLQVLLKRKSPLMQDLANEHVKSSAKNESQL